MLNAGPSTINIDYASAGEADESYGVVNEGSGTVNVNTVHSSSANFSSGVANYSNGTVNVTYANYENTKVGSTLATCLWNIGTGTINAKRAGFSSFRSHISVVNAGFCFVNIKEYDGILQGPKINTYVSELNLLKGSSGSCLLDSIIISNIAPTQIGTPPQSYISTINGSCGNWFANEAKTIPSPILAALRPCKYNHKFY